MIYELEKKEGFHLASELEALRKKKKYNKIDVICTEIVSEQIKTFQKAFILNTTIHDILFNAHHYYMQVENNRAAVYLLYDTCHIAYHLRADSDWKIIYIEIVSPKLCFNVCHEKNDLTSRIMASALIIMATYCCTHGFSRVFDLNKIDEIQKILSSIINNEEIITNKFGTIGGIDTYITTLFAQHAMQKEFVTKYLPQIIIR